MTRSSVASACIVGAMLLATATGCARRAIPAARIPVTPLVDVPPFTRVLVAGFVSMPVAGVDGNEETSRLLRRELRSEVSLDVVNMEPLRLQSPMLEEVPFWRRLGEEYREPLIVTGVVDFKSAGRWYEERQVGRRTVRLWLPQYSLTVRLLLIDGKTGQRIAAAVCGPALAHAATGRERALSLYYRLIDRTMPSILAIFGRRMMLRSTGAPTCRTERVEGRAES
jgi:hypothetical protein